MAVGFTSTPRVSTVPGACSFTGRGRIVMYGILVDPTFYALFGACAFVIEIWWAVAHRPRGR